jgi:hypothetical protein
MKASSSIAKAHKLGMMEECVGVACYEGWNCHGFGLFKPQTEAFQKERRRFQPPRAQQLTMAGSETVRRSSFINAKRILHDAN